MKSLQGRRVCLVSSGHIGSNPRLIKEADALHAAGAAVHVISVEVTRHADVQQRDAAVLAKAPWSNQRVGNIGRWQRVINALIRRSSRLFYGAGIRSTAVLHRALHPMIPALASAASRIDAEIFIAHNLAALPAAAIAARNRKARLGFDAEDFHSGELLDTVKNSVILNITQTVERMYLPQCDYVTAASPLIARAYAQDCGIAVPVVINNVFPLSMAPSSPQSPFSENTSPSLYWVSQTIGPFRGLEQIIAAVGLARSKPRLYLQGTFSPGYDEELRVLAAKVGIADRLFLLPPLLPDDLIRNMSQYDAGLTSEVTGTELNRSIALTNKMFSYLLAGIPVLASDTPAQVEFAKEAGVVVKIYPHKDAAASARIIDSLFADRERLSSLRKQAWELGQKRYNWEVEQQIYLATVASVLV